MAGKELVSVGCKEISIGHKILDGCVMFSTWLSYKTVLFTCTTSVNCVHSNTSTACSVCLIASDLIVSGMFLLQIYSKS